MQGMALCMKMTAAQLTPDTQQSNFLGTDKARCIVGGGCRLACLPLDMHFQTKTTHDTTTPVTDAESENWRRMVQLSQCDWIDP